MEGATGSSAADPERDAPPPVLGGVRLGRLLGEGGMGRVHAGLHEILGIDVAVKLLHDRRGDRARFLAEAQLAARVCHEHVVRVLHAGDESGWRFLVMELVRGGNLKQLVLERERLPWREAANLALQAARGLAAAHRLGVVHRDVKPSNLLLSAEGLVKVTDLGLARSLAGDRDATVSGGIVGTPAFMAPEQALDPHAATPAADVYGLGATLYFLLTGDVPYPGLGYPALLDAHRRGARPDPRRATIGVPAKAAELVASFMAPRPEDRPADGAAAAHALEGLLGLTTVSTVAPAPERRQPPRRLAVAAGLAALALLTAWLAQARGGEPVQAAANVGPLPLPVGEAVAAPDPWQSPPRALFVLPDRLDAAATAALTEACRASGLPQVERQRLDALIREQDLQRSGRGDPATATRLGRLVGGHIALFATAVDGQVELRIVLVETGELAAARLVAPADVATDAAAGLATAAALLPARGRVAVAPGGQVAVSLGQRHGLQRGDRLALVRTPDGPPFATATVTEVGRDRARLAVEDGAAADGALAVRMPAP